MNKYIYILIAFFLWTLSTGVFAQEEEDDWGSLLEEEVEVENPVYKPVISLSAGVLSFYGDLNNDFGNMFSGRPAFRVNVNRYVDKLHYLKMGFFVLRGNLTGIDKSRNLNFSSSIMAAGINVLYEFGH